MLSIGRSKLTRGYVRNAAPIGRDRSMDANTIIKVYPISPIEAPRRRYTIVVIAMEESKPDIPRYSSISLSVDGIKAKMDRVRGYTAFLDPCIPL
jgi:hypothetical protein